MDVPAVFLWVALAVLAVLLSWLFKRHMGRLVIAGVLGCLGLLSLGYLLGFSAAKAGQTAPAGYVWAISLIVTAAALMYVCSWCAAIWELLKGNDEKQQKDQHGGDPAG